MGVKRKLSEDDPTNQVGEESPVKEEAFSVHAFEKRLRSDSFFSALERFVKDCRKKTGSKDVAVQFLEGGGQVSWVVGILDSGRNMEMEDMSILCNTLEILIMRCMTDVPSQKANAMEACRRLLGSHIIVVNQMLGAFSFKGRRSILQLLTAVVSLDVSLAREVLNRVTFTSNLVEILTDHGKAEDTITVRICFIRFLLSFLVGGNDGLILSLLEKKGLLTSILPGLKYDPPDLIVLVLTTLRTKVAEHPKIMKTVKRLTFHTHVLLYLVELYEWEGPENDIPKGRKAHKPNNNQETVVNAVHQLLMILCTSHKLGVIFADKNQNEATRRENPLVLNFILKLDKPWEHKLIAELVAATIRSCPDLAEPVFGNLAPFLRPRDSDGWFSAISFAIKLISDVNNVTTGVVGPLINIVQTLVMEGIYFYHEGVSATSIVFLHAVLKKLGSNSRLMKVLPDTKAFQVIWESVLDHRTKPTVKKTVIPVPLFHQRLSLLIDFMSLYQEHHPLLLDVGVDTPLFNSLIKSLDISSTEDTGIISLQVKLINFLICVTDASFIVNKELLNKMLRHLLNACCLHLKDVANLAQKTLGKLLTSCNLVSSSSLLELEIWIHCCSTIHPKERSAVLKFLCELIESCACMTASIEKTLGITEQILDTKNCSDVVQSDITDKVFAELLEEREDADMLDPKNFSGCKEVSPLLMSAINYANTHKLDSSVEKYLCSVLIHTLHLQSTPQQYLTIVNLWKHMPTELAKYMKGWQKDGTPGELTMPLKSYSPESALSRLLLDPKRPPPELEDNTSSTAIILLLRLVVFHVAQLAEINKLTIEVIDAAQSVLSSLLRAAEQVSSDLSEADMPLSSESCVVGCLKFVLRHPVLIQYFTPLHKKKGGRKHLVTSFLLEFVHSNSDLLNSYKEKNIDIVLRKKFLINVNYYIEKPHKMPTNCEDAICAFAAMPLSSEEVVNIVQKLISVIPMHIQNPTWQCILEKLLPISSCLPETSVTELSNSIANLCQQDADSVVPILKSFHKYLSQFTRSCSFVSQKLFKSLLGQPVFGKVATELSVLLVEHNATFVPCLTKEVNKKGNFVLHNPNLLFALLGVVHKHGTPPEKLLMKTYTEYSKVIERSLQNKEETESYLTQFVDVGVMLLTTCMEKKNFKILRKAVGRECKSSDPCSPFQLACLMSGVNESGVEFMMMVLQQVLIQEKICEEYVKRLCSVLDTCFKKKSVQVPMKYDWIPIFTLMLKVALSDSNDHCSEYLLTTMTHIFIQLKLKQHAAFVFELIVSHSRFFSIVFDKEDTNMKLALLELLYECTVLDEKVIKRNHVPVWLGAYKATLSPIDQILLKMLQYYEQSGMNLYEYRPFLWGEAAIGHYSVRARAGLSLWRVPQVSVILDLLRSELVENTITYFPFQRSFEANKKFTSLKVKDKVVYDPAFILPLLVHITSSEMALQTHYFARCGALGIVLVALGSVHSTVRSAACTVLARYYIHLEGDNTRKNTNKLLLQFLDAVRAGLNELKNKEEIPRLPCISAVFLGRVSIILTEPYNPLYAPLLTYVFAVPVMKLNVIPDFFNLLHSNNINFRVYQYWILELIRDGIQTAKDINIVINFGTLKSLMSLYICTLADHRIQILILQIVKAAVMEFYDLPSLRSCGLKPWILSVSRLKNHEDEEITHLINDISTCIQSQNR